MGPVNTLARAAEDGRQGSTRAGPGQSSRDGTLTREDRDMAPKTTDASIYGDHDRYDVIHHHNLICDDDYYVVDSEGEPETGRFDTLREAVEWIEEHKVSRE